MKAKFISLLIIGVAFSISCDPVSTEDQVPDYSETDKELETPTDPVGDPLKPLESRAKLEQIGRDLIALANPNKQKELLKVIDEFYLISEDLEIEYRGFPTKAADALLAPMKEICNGNTKAAMQYAMVKNTYIYSLQEALGIYTHQGETWKHDASSEVFELRFKVNGEDVVISVKPSGETYEYSYVDKWENNYEGNQYEDTYVIKVPGTINASITKGSATLASLTVQGKYRVGGSDPLYSDVSLIMGPYDIKANAHIGTDAVTGRVIFNVDGQSVLNTKAELKGTFNLSPDYYLNDEGEWDYVTEFINVNNFETAAKILDLRLAAACADLKDFEKTFIAIEEKGSSEDNNWSGYGTPYSCSKNHVGRICSFINTSTTNSASYSDGPAFAKIEFTPTYSEYINYNGRTVEGYFPEPLLVFEDDGAKFSFEEFFNENDFQNVFKDYEDLIYMYMNCLPNIFNDL